MDGTDNRMSPLKDENNRMEGEKKEGRQQIENGDRKSKPRLSLCFQ